MSDPEARAGMTAIAYFEAYKWQANANQHLLHHRHRCPLPSRHAFYPPGGASRRGPQAKGPSPSGRAAHPAKTQGKVQPLLFKMGCQVDLVLGPICSLNA